MQRRVLLMFGCIVSVFLSVTSQAQRGTSAGQWPNHSGDKGSTKYASLDQITRSNVRNLHVAWRRPAVAEELRAQHPGMKSSNLFRSTPLMIDGVLYASNGIGLVEAFDPATGKTFRVIPRDGEFGVDTWENRSWEYTGGVNAWSNLSADEDLGYIYLPLTSPTSDMYGGHRLGNNLFSDSLVCLKVETGERVWHFQLVHHDLWDYDSPAAPILADIRVNGKPIKAVVQVTKQGFAFVFDRVTGQPVWLIDERAVRQSATPGERTSPTQPFPTRPAPFERQGVSIDQLIDFTPELRNEAIDITKRYVVGPLFTPPSVKGDGPNDTRGTLQLPGSVGGADWNGAALDPETGIL